MRAGLGWRHFGCSRPVPVTVAFVLPAGNPRVSYFAHSLVFDYGRHEVEIRFQIGGMVRVIER
jgi:hypothetical protein